MLPSVPSSPSTIPRNAFNAGALRSLNLRDVSDYKVRGRVRKPFDEINVFYRRPIFASLLLTPGLTTSPPRLIARKLVRGRHSRRNYLRDQISSRASPFRLPRSTSAGTCNRIVAASPQFAGLINPPSPRDIWWKSIGWRSISSPDLSVIIRANRYIVHQFSLT